MSDAFLNEAELPFRYCPGCSHGPVLEAAIAALERQGLAPRDVVVVTDIGCVGLADRYLNCSTFHGLHGRSIAYAMGLKIARPALHVLTLIGDGGIGIGASHLVAAARRNVGVAVVVFNNFNFGMTGGQQSVTTPQGARTSTTPMGNLESPLDVCALARAAGATFVARVSAFDKELPSVLAAAITHPGFALVDVWEICTAHYMRANQFKKSDLERALAATEHGILHRVVRPEFAATLQEATQHEAQHDLWAPFRVEQAELAQVTAKADPVSISLAGRAGMKVRYAASLLARAAIGEGLCAAQIDDFPITVLTGFSLSDVLLSAEPIDDLAAEPASILLALADEGYARFRGRNRTARKVYRLASVKSLAAGEIEISLPHGTPKDQVALRALAQVVDHERLLSATGFSRTLARHGLSL